MSLQHHVNYNSVARSKSREREMEKKDSDNTQGRSKEKKEEKDRKDRKRVSSVLGKVDLSLPSFVKPLVLNIYIRVATRGKYFHT